MATVTDREEILAEDIQPRDLSYIIPKLKERQTLNLQSHSLPSENLSSRCCPKFKVKTLLKFTVVCLLVLAGAVAYSVTQVNQGSTLESLASATSELVGENTGYDVSIELSPQQSFQHCKGPTLKQTFPDVGYALFGYNLLRGFPLTAGHDPGFTFPIFKVDYSSEQYSADCRYFMPDGLLLAADISCELSLSTTIAQTEYEYSKALGVFVGVEVTVSPYAKLVKTGNDLMKKVTKKGGIISPWGASFTGSVGYGSVSTVMSTGRSVYALSTAKCSQYYSKLSLHKPPEFDDAFISWIRRLNTAGFDKELYYSFFETYGTHFPTEVTFGARYTAEHKLTSIYYQSLRERKVDVALTASYANHKFSIEGQLDVSVQTKKLVSEFLENSETRIVPVGAYPPKDGNVLTWAREVKDNPLPIALKLSSIENLFTEHFMKHLNIDYKKIHDNINNVKLDYCLFLRTSGVVQTCDNLSPGILLKNTRLTRHYKETALGTISNCFDICLKDDYCVAVSLCDTCTNSDPGYQTCYMYAGTSISSTALKTEEPGAIWQSYIFPEKMRIPFRLLNTGVIGVPRLPENEAEMQTDLTGCKEACTKDAYCSAFVLNEGLNPEKMCEMYSKEHITGLEETLSLDTYFLPSLPGGVETTTPQN